MSEISRKKIERAIVKISATMLHTSLSSVSNFNGNRVRRCKRKEDRFSHRRLLVNLRTKVRIKHSSTTRLVIVCAARNGLTGIDCQIRVG